MSKQTDLIDFVNDPQNIAKAAEGSMEKRNRVMNPIQSDDELREKIRKAVVEPTGNQISTADIAVGFRSSTDLDTIVHKLMQIIEADRHKSVEEARRLGFTTEVQLIFDSCMDEDFGTFDAKLFADKVLERHHQLSSPNTNDRQESKSVITHKRTRDSFCGLYEGCEININRDKDSGDDFYIVVRAKYGVLLYDCWWDDSSDATIDQAIEEALYGSCLKPRPTTNPNSEKEEKE